MTRFVPNVIETTPRGERYVDLYSRLLGERIVFIGTPIDDDVANLVVAELLHLAAASPEHDISLYLNSPGGSHSAALAIYDTMCFVAPPIATTCVGVARSCAALLLAAGAPGKRSLLPHASVRLQQPASGLNRGSMSDLAIEAAELEQTRHEFEAILARHTGRTTEQIRADTDRALVLRSEEAISYGIADRIMHPEAPAASAAPVSPAHPASAHAARASRVGAER